MSAFEVVELTFHTTHDASEILAFWLHESGALGVTIVDPEEIRADLARPDSLDYAGKDFLDSLPETVVLTAWFYKDGEDMLIREEAGSGMVYAEKAPVRMNALAFIASIGDRLQMLHEESGEKDVNLGFQSVLVVKPEDWEDNWKKYQKPLRIGERFVVVPTWHEGEVEEKKDDDLEILLDAGMAFGSGSHETTRLCLELMEKTLKPGDEVLDLGTGSGILAIGAKKLGAARVLAVDIDPQAVKTAKENAKTNRVEISFHTGTLDDVDDTFDLVVANIVFDVLSKLRSDFLTKVKPGGKLICSGILSDDVEQFASLMAESGFHCVKETSDNDWHALLFQREDLSS